MRPSHPIKIGAYVLIIANLLMSLGSIWMFNRMAPAIERIIERNERSMQACEEMLAALSLTFNTAAGIRDDSLRTAFLSALVKAERNITESDEPQAIAIIRKNFNGAFQNDLQARTSAVTAIMRLGEINRVAMVNADANARQTGSAGAWGVVFMATGIFIFGVIFLRKMEGTLIEPLSEIHAVFAAHENSDTRRRCTESGAPASVAVLYRLINGILDRNQHL